MANQSVEQNIHDALFKVEDGYKGPHVRLLDQLSDLERRNNLKPKNIVSETILTNFTDAIGRFLEKRVTSKEMSDDKKTEEASRLYGIAEHGVKDALWGIGTGDVSWDHADVKVAELKERYKWKKDDIIAYSLGYSSTMAIRQPRHTIDWLKEVAKQEGLTEKEVIGENATWLSITREKMPQIRELLGGKVLSNYEHELDQEMRTTGFELKQFVNPTKIDATTHPNQPMMAHVDNPPHQIYTPIKKI